MTELPYNGAGGQAGSRVAELAGGTVGGLPDGRARRRRSQGICLQLDGRVHGQMSGVRASNRVHERTGNQARGRAGAQAVEHKDR